MRLVSLRTHSGEVSINPETVISVQQDLYGKFVLVKTMDNQVHEIQRDYGEQIWDAQRRVTKLLNGDEG